MFHNISQKDLAQKLETSNSHLSEIESGKKQPSITLLQRYSEAFDIPASSIFFFAENLAESEQGKAVEGAISSKVLIWLEFIAERD